MQNRQLLMIKIGIVSYHPKVNTIEYYLKVKTINTQQIIASKRLVEKRKK